MAAPAQRDRITRHLEDVYCVRAEHLWARYPDYAVFRHPVTGKWFAALLNVPRSRLGLDGAGDAELLNLKCSPLMLGSLLSQDGFLPAYHMNKSTWLSICLCDAVSDEQIAPLLEWSYDSVSPKKRRKSVGGNP